MTNYHLMYERKWDVITQGVERMRIPNGWLVKSSTIYGEAICFVSDPDLEWMLPKQS